MKKVCEFDQKIPQSQTADQPTAPCGRDTILLQAYAIKRQLKYSNKLYPSEMSQFPHNHI